MSEIKVGHFGAPPSTTGQDEGGKLNLEAPMTIKTLKSTLPSHAEVARLLEVSEGTVRHQRRRLEEEGVDGRSNQQRAAAEHADVIARWHRMHKDAGINLRDLHARLVSELRIPGECGH